MTETKTRKTRREDVKRYRIASVFLRWLESGNNWTTPRSIHAVRRYMVDTETITVDDIGPTLDSGLDLAGWELRMPLGVLYAPAGSALNYTRTNLLALAEGFQVLADEIERELDVNGIVCEYCNAVTECVCGSRDREDFIAGYQRMAEQDDREDFIAACEYCHATGGSDGLDADCVCED